jgi:hypothetical protein
MSLLVVLVGCGASDQQEVAAVLRSSDAAWDRRDFDEACWWMTARARRDYMGDAIGPGARTCSEAYESRPVEQVPGTATTVALVVVSAKPPRLTDIRVNGNTAVASYSNGDRTQLRKVNGRWLIDSF